MVGKGLWWDKHLNQDLLTKPAEVVQKACQVMEKHGCYVTKELKSEHTLPSCVPSTALCQLAVWLELQE